MELAWKSSTQLTRHIKNYGKRENEEKKMMDRITEWACRREIHFAELIMIQRNGKAFTSYTLTMIDRMQLKSRQYWMKKKENKEGEG